MTAATAHGIVISDSDQSAVTELDNAIDHLLHFQADASEINDRALAIDPDLVLARVFRAYMGLLGTESDDAAAAKVQLDSWLSGHAGRAFTPAERAHLDAANAWLSGDMRTAGRILRAHTDVNPRDALALAVGHQIDFFCGDAATLRDRVGSALPEWGTDDPHRAQLLGMLAFGLEEAGDYTRAFDVGVEAVETDPRDVWAIHAVTHTNEMRGRFGEGTRFLLEREGDWATGNFLNVHNWWHRALFLLESGQPSEALAIYDAWIHNEESAGMAMEMLDATALLWRLYLEGADQTSRWQLLADVWAAKPEVPYYAFNDMHAVMSYVGAGRVDNAKKVIDRQIEWLNDAQHRSITNVGMTRDVGLPVMRSIVDFALGRYDAVLERLLPIRYRINEFGGSHAQRDAVQRTMVEAALRGGRLDVARTLIAERITIKPTSPYNWLKQAELSDQLGRAAQAAAARARAGELAASGGE